MYKRQDGETITAGVGRFGPFVKHGTTYASLTPDDDPYTVDLARALELIRAKAEAAANRIIKDFGNGTQVLNGRYGPYISDGEKNAKIPKDREPASLTEAECAELIAAAPFRPKRGGRFGKDKSGKTTKPAKNKSDAAAVPKKVAAKKTPARKAAATKTAAKKTGAREPAAKKTVKKAAAKKATARPAAGTP